MEVKPCEYCKELPIYEAGIEISDFLKHIEKYKLRCPRCNISTKSFYSLDGAIEAWNRGTEE